MKAMVPIVVDIRLVPPSDPQSSNQAVLKFVFGEVATAPSPSLQQKTLPRTAAESSTATEGASSKQRQQEGGGAAAMASSSGASSSSSSEDQAQPAYVATELHSPFRITSCNAKFCELTGYAESALIGQTFDLLYGSGTDATAVNALRRACTLRHQIAVRIVAYDAARTPFVLTMHVTPVSNGETSAGGTVSGLLFSAERERIASPPQPQPPSQLSSSGQASLTNTLLQSNPTLLASLLAQSKQGPIGDRTLLPPPPPRPPRRSVGDAAEAMPPPAAPGPRGHGHGAPGSTLAESTASTTVTTASLSGHNQAAHEAAEALLEAADIKAKASSNQQQGKGAGSSSQASQQGGGGKQAQQAPPPPNAKGNKVSGYGSSSSTDDTARAGSGSGSGGSNHSDTAQDSNSDSGGANGSSGDGQSNDASSNDAASGGDSNSNQDNTSNNDQDSNNDASSDKGSANGSSEAQGDLRHQSPNEMNDSNSDHSGDGSEQTFTKDDEAAAAAAAASDAKNKQAGSSVVVSNKRSRSSSAENDAASSSKASVQRVETESSSRMGTDSQSRSSNSSSGKVSPPDDPSPPPDSESSSSQPPQQQPQVRLRLRDPHAASTAAAQAAAEEERASRAEEAAGEEAALAMAEAAAMAHASANASAHASGHGSVTGAEEGEEEEMMEMDGDSASGGSVRAGGADPADAALFSGCVALMVAASERAEHEKRAGGSNWAGSGNGNGGGGGGGGSRERPAPFLSKLMQILETPSYRGTIHWGDDAEQPGNPRFIIEDPNGFSKNILPHFFKHNKLSSFIQQLYTYGFRRVSDPSAALRLPESYSSQAPISFHHPLFRADAYHLLTQIKRNVPTGNTSGSAAAAYPGGSSSSCSTSNAAATAAAASALAAIPSGTSNSSLPIAVAEIHGDIDGMGHDNYSSYNGDAYVDDDEMMDGTWNNNHSGHGGGGGGGMMSLSAHDAAEAQSLLGEIERLEEAIDALKRMQAERHTTDSRWLEEMMRTVQVSKAAKGTTPLQRSSKQDSTCTTITIAPFLLSLLSPHPFPLPLPAATEYLDRAGALPCS